MAILSVPPPTAFNPWRLLPRSLFVVPVLVVPLLVHSVAAADTSPMEMLLPPHVAVAWREDPRPAADAPAGVEVPQGRRGTRRSQRRSTRRRPPLDEMPNEAVPVRPPLRDQRPAAEFFPVAPSEESTATAVATDTTLASPVPTAADATGITTHRDQPYGRPGSGQPTYARQRFDLYLPAGCNAGGMPLVVWIHGGGWKNGDKAQVNQAILRLSEEGYAVASINYRLEDLSIHPKQIHDCKGAVRWLRAHADAYGYDPARVAVGGGSAGGHLALLLGMSGGVEDLEGNVGGNTAHTGLIRAIIDLYGPSELTVFSKNSERFNQAHKFTLGQLPHASPLTYLTPDDPPILILQGDKDTTVPLEQSQLLDRRYKEAGLVSELHIIPGAGHGGAVFSDEERYRLIKAFLDKHL